MYLKKQAFSKRQQVLPLNRGIIKINFKGVKVRWLRRTLNLSQFKHVAKILLHKEAHPAHVRQEHTKKALEWTKLYQPFFTREQITKKIVLKNIVPLIYRNSNIVIKIMEFTDYPVCEIKSSMLRTYLGNTPSYGR